MRLGLEMVVCFQPSRAPVGPCWGTAKSPERDGTAQESPSSSVNSQDGCDYEGR